MKSIDYNIIEYWCFANFVSGYVDEDRVNNGTFHSDFSQEYKNETYTVYYKLFFRNGECVKAKCDIEMRFGDEEIDAINTNSFLLPELINNFLDLNP